MTPPGGRRQALQLAKQGWTLLVLAGLAYYLWHNGGHLLATLRAISPGNLLGALGCILVGKLAALNLMRGSLLLQGLLPMPWRESLWVYTSSDVAKYMPGGIWAIVGRVVHYRNHGMSAAGISKALFLEHVGFALTALIVALPVGWIVLDAQGWLTAWTAVMAGVLLLLGLLVTLRVARRLELWAVSWRVASGPTVVALLAMSVGWVAMGTSFALLLPQQGDLLQWLWAVGGYVVAFIAGMAAVFAPAGAGIREGVLVLLGQFSGLTAATMVDAAILNRALWVLADICLFGFSVAARLPGK